jgi:hypothetical protein
MFLGSCEMHLHLEDATLRPVVYSYTPGDNVQYGLGFELGRDPLTVHDIIHDVENTPVGIHLTIPFDLGWPGPPRGPRWTPDPGYPTGIYSSRAMIDGRR